METQVKNRGWVKNVAIIFLAVALALTFFSNTILNRSLPEVATQAIRGGTVTAQIRGSGTVSASQNYEVKVEQSRKVNQVMVREGQTVSTGDVLFVLAADSKELEDAQEQLRQLQRNYQTALINASGTDYAQQERNIQQARDALAEAEAERDKNTYSEAELTGAERALEEAKAGVASAEAGLDQVKASLRSIGIYDELDAASILQLQKSVKEKESALAAARTELDAAKLMYGRRYDWLKARAELLIKESKEYKALPQNQAQQQEYIDSMRTAYMEYVLFQIQQNEQALPDGEWKEATYYGGERHVENDPEAVAMYQEAYQKITAAQAAYDAAETVYYGQNSSLPEILSRAEPALNALSTAMQRQESAQKALDDAKQRKADYDSAVERVKTLQNTLDDQLFALQQSQQQGYRDAALRALELQDLNEQIEKQQALVDELTEKSDGTEVTAAVNGIIGNLSVTAGNTTVPGSALCTIEVPDMGYLLSFSVSAEQARRVHVGDSANVSNMYWGSQIEATLTSVKPDPRDPQNSRLLSFEVNGDVTPGTTLTLTVGERSADYDFVVPNSALRSDTNGDFILVVTAKSSPLGDRYIATRVDVTKLANDDTTTAVSGGLNLGDFVITTSTAPIKNGDRVRLADNQS